MDYKWGALLTALLLLPIASAASGGGASGVSAQLLGASAQEAQCRNDFMVGYINAIIAAVPNSSASLSGLPGTLQADIVTLKGYAASGDVSGYRDYLRGTYDPALKTARETIAQTKPWRGASSDTRAGLKSSYAQLRQTFDACQLSAAQAFGQAKVAAYQQYLDEYANRTNMISSRNGTRGMDTGSMSQLVSDAGSQIVGPLQSAVSAASNVSGVREALGRYCLYDGCKDGVNFHLAARYEAVRLAATLAFVESRAGANASSYFAQADADLATAQATLASVGTSPYSDGGAQIHSELKAVAEDLKSGLASWRSAMRANRQGGRGRNNQSQGVSG